MTNAEIIQAIRNEIERRKKALHSTLFNDEYNDFLSFLDSLESEKPMNQEGLEKEIDRVWKQCNPIDEGMGVESTYMHIEAFNIIARHFYDFGCTSTAEKYDEIEYNRQRAEESVPNDLEEAARKYLDELFGKGKHQTFYKELFIAGAEWQAEQLLKSSPLPEDTVLFNKGVAEGKRLMMEEAVDAIVENWNPDSEPEITIPLNPEEFTCGDKVRIIIIKDDEKSD